MEAHGWQLLEIFETYDPAQQQWAKAQAAGLKVAIRGGWTPDGSPIHLLWWDRKAVEAKAETPRS